VGRILSALEDRVRPCGEECAQMRERRTGEAWAEVGKKCQGKSIYIGEKMISFGILLFQ